ncbi:MAG: hypothetical protein EZS28_035346 [Streblomastix strix]|uniref:Uncharacterized protein n=1 Tax=Streblomastix strix TaxID=222440 RepID=A0A5J4UEE3_9EUKA|nr:MAG: hypothetical protein EZS28_035346 [Streblomastix strix]
MRELMLIFKICVELRLIIHFISCTGLYIVAQGRLFSKLCSDVENQSEMSICTGCTPCTGTQHECLHYRYVQLKTGQLSYCPPTFGRILGPCAPCAPCADGHFNQFPYDS